MDLDTARRVNLLECLAGMHLAIPCVPYQHAVANIVDWMKRIA